MMIVFKNGTVLPTDATTCKWHDKLKRIDFTRRGVELFSVNPDEVRIIFYRDEEFKKYFAQDQVDSFK